MRLSIVLNRLQMEELFNAVEQEVDCKVVGFFLKISKVIGKAWRKSLTRARREKNIFLASLPSLTLRFQPRSRPFV